MLDIKIKKIIATVLCAATLLCSAGCGKSGGGGDVELSGKEYTLQIPTSDSTYYSLTVPEEYAVTSYDNVSYWTLAQNVEVYCTSVQNHLATDQSEGSGLYVNSKSVSLDIDDHTISIRCSKNQQELFKTVLRTGKLTECHIDLYADNRLNKFPKYEIQNMTLYDNNLYMPDGAQETKLNVYTASLVLNGREFIMSWIQDGKVEDIKDKIACLCLCNSGRTVVEQWYQDDDIVYVEAGDHIAVAKKLRANEWYIYLGTKSYKNYALTGAVKVHGED